MAWILGIVDDQVGVFPIQKCCGVTPAYVRIRTHPIENQNAAVQVDYLCESCFEKPDHDDDGDDDEEGVLH